MISGLGSKVSNFGLRGLHKPFTDGIRRQSLDVPMVLIFAIACSPSFRVPA